MEINKDEIKRLSELLLSPEEIAVQLSYPVIDVKEWMEDHTHPFYLAYTAGRGNTKMKLNEMNHKLMLIGAPNALKSIESQLYG